MLSIDHIRTVFNIVKSLYIILKFALFYIFSAYQDTSSHFLLSNVPVDV